MRFQRIDEDSLNLRISFISVIINAIFAILQGIIGVFSNSIAVIVDAIDSARDILTSIVVIVSLYISKKPADKTHPFGHGRSEDIGGLIVSIFLILIGFNFFKDSFLRLFHPQTIRLNYFMIKIIFFIAIVKVILGLITHKISLYTKSSLLQAEAFHHYSDSFSTFAVAVGLLFVKKTDRFLYLDSILGILISFVILYWSFKMTKEFIDNLIGKHASPILYEQIKKIALSFEAVKGVHDIEVHTYGKNKIILLHIEMPSYLSLEEAHSIADNIEKKIYEEKLGRCVVHVDLKDSFKPIEKKEIEKLLKDTIVLTKNIKGFHGMEIIRKADKSILNFHLLLDKNTSLKDSHEISHRLSGILKKKFKFFQVNIHIEPYEGQKEVGYGG